MVLIQEFTKTAIIIFLGSNVKYLLTGFLLLTFSSPLHGQFKCIDSGAFCSNQNDQTCRFVRDVWNMVKDKEDSWSSTIQEHVIEDPNKVRYSSVKNYCGHNFYNDTNNVAEVSIDIIKESPTEQTYKVIHSSCGQQGVLVEKWEIRGEQLPPINKKDIVFQLKRKFDLAGGETYKKFTLKGVDTLELKSYERPSSFFPFKVGILLQHTTFKEGAPSEGDQKIKSYLKLFDKDLMYQSINLSRPETQLYFYSPAFPFYNETNREAFAQRDFVESKCEKSYLNIKFDKYLTMKTRLTNLRHGLGKPDLQSMCFNQELNFYKDEASKILEVYVDEYFPSCLLYTSDAADE